MIKRVSKSAKVSPKALSPWHSKNKEIEDSYMNEYCQSLQNIHREPMKSLTSKISGQENAFNFTMNRISNKRKSICYTSNQQKAECMRIFQRLATSTNKENKRFIKSSNENRKKAIPLQELIPRNYILQGSREPCIKQAVKKKQPTYVMKHKFAQVRRNNKMRSGLWSNLFKHGRENDENQENVLLKLTRYDFS